MRNRHLLLVLVILLSGLIRMYAAAGTYNPITDTANAIDTERTTTMAHEETHRQTRVLGLAALASVWLFLAGLLSGSTLTWEAGYAGFIATRGTSEVIAWVTELGLAWVVFPLIMVSVNLIGFSYLLQHKAWLDDPVRIGWGLPRAMALALFVSTL